MASWKRPLWKMYNFVFNGGLVKICPIAPSLVALIFNWKLGTRNLAFTNNHQHGSYKLFPTLYFQETTSNTHLYMHHVADLHVYKCISFWWQFKHYCRYTDIPNVPITYLLAFTGPRGQIGLEWSRSWSSWSLSWWYTGTINNRCIKVRICKDLSRTRHKIQWSKRSIFFFVWCSSNKLWAHLNYHEQTPLAWTHSALGSILRVFDLDTQWKCIIVRTKYDA